MPGIDVTRFVNIGTNGEDLTCGICLAIFVEPLVTQCCGQTYCNDCIKEWLKTNKTCPNDRKDLTVNTLLKPPRFLVNMISKLKITCNFSGNGCEEVINYGQYEAHVKRCRYNPDALCADCGIKNGNRREHNCVQLLKVINDELSECQRESNTTIKRLKEELDDKESDIKRYKLDINKLEQENRVLQQKPTDLSGRVTQQRSHDTTNGVTRVVTAIDTQTHNNINNTHNIQFTVNIDVLINQQLIGIMVDSQVSRINGFRWKISATKEKNNSELEYLGIHMVCDSDSNAKVWSRNVSVHLIVIPQTRDCTRFVLQCGSHTFTNVDNIWSFPKFIRWQFVSRKIYGFVKNDNILIEARLTFID